MKGFRFEPVRWAAGVLAFVTAVIGANELVHDVAGVDIIPAGATPYLLGAEALLALLLGSAVRSRTTALAAPRDAAGVPLAPVDVTTTSPVQAIRPDQRPRGWSA